MKITFTKEINLTNGTVDIAVNLKKETATITVSYTCPECQGYGCRFREPGCNNGSLLMTLDPTQLDKNLDKETVDKLRTIVSNLATSMGRSFSGTQSRFRDENR